MAGLMPRARAPSTERGEGEEGGMGAGDAMVTTGYISLVMWCHKIEVIDLLRVDRCSQNLS